MLTWPNHACCCVHHSSFQGWSKVGLENCRTAMTSLRRGRHWNIMNPKPLFYMQWTFSKCIFVYSRYRVRNFEPKIPVNVCNFPFDSGIYVNTVKTYTSWIFARCQCCNARQNGAAYTDKRRPHSAEHCLSNHVVKTLLVELCGRQCYGIDLCFNSLSKQWCKQFMTFSLCALNAHEREHSFCWL